MRRTAIALLLVLSLAACQKHDEHAGHVPATTEATPATSETTAPSTPAAAAPRNDGPMTTFGDGASGYLAVSANEGRKPALIVIQEWWGVDNWIRSQTDRFAQQGYVALAVDLYRGRVAADAGEAHELARGLPEDRAMGDLKAAVDFLAQRPDVDPQRIGVIGWCLGGGYALALAAEEPRIKATVINYGRLITDPSTLAKINGEVLGNFGGADRGIPAADVNAFAERLTRLGKLSDVKVYEGEGHAFMNPDNKDGYDASATRDAWGRIDRFFARTLRVNMPNS